MADEKFQRMARSLPSLYKAETNVMIRGLLQSWGISDDEVTIQVQNTKEQLFVSTAASRFLNSLGDNVGVPRTPELGLDDQHFRELVPVLSFYPKQVRGTLISLLDVFWGPGFTRANVNSNNIENYNLGPIIALTGVATFKPGNKTVTGVGTLFTTELQPGDYIKPQASSSKEFVKVSAIDEDGALQLSSEWPFDVEVNVSIVKADITTLEYISDSRNNKILRILPNAFEDLLDVSAQEIADFINANIEHNTFITGSVFLDPLAGNKLNIRTTTPGLQGSIQILGGSANTVLDFPLTKQTEVKASVYEINPNEVVIQIPSSVPVLRRTLKGSAHLKESKTEIFSNEETFDFSSLGPTSTLTLDVDGNPYTITFVNASDFQDPSAATNEEVSAVINAQVPFLEAFFLSPESIKSVGLRTTDGSMEYQITGGTANTILGFSTVLQQDPDLIVTTYPSAYIFDPVGQLFTVTGINSELAATIDQGAVQSTISLVNASSFPNQPGKILINFGRSGQEGPINYSSRPNNSTLLIDASHIFENEHTIGRKVNFISNQPSLPRVTGDDYAVYVTGTEEARVAAQALIRKLIASGVIIRFIIDFPEVLFLCEITAPTSADYKGELTAGVPPLVC